MVGYDDRLAQVVDELYRIVWKESREAGSLRALH